MKNSFSKAEIFIFIFLVFIGSARAFANIVDMEKTSAVFSALNISPAMKVFTAHNGYETFSPKFVLEFHSNTESKNITLTPELYRELTGPYNRRNVYGAAISYGPVLVSNPQTISMFENVAKYSFCTPGTLVSELRLQVPQPVKSVTVHYIHQPGNKNDQFPSTLEVKCERL